MDKLVEIIVKHLVRHKDDVKVETRESKDAINITIYVNEDDKGRVIGKNGTIANAIRAIVKTAGSDGDKKYFIKINEKR